MYLLFSLSLVITSSFIDDVFSDDRGHRKRYRHRQVFTEDDNDLHEGKDHLDPVTNQKYQELCGGCHFAYQPGLLPLASWQKILEQLDDHFGEKIEIDADEAEVLSLYFKKNSAETSSAEDSKKIMRCLGGRTPIRITDIPYIRKKHSKLHVSVFKRKSVGSFSNCIACHTTAESGNYDDDDVKIPE
jgi:hypothetical protein